MALCKRDLLHHSPLSLKAVLQLHPAPPGSTRLHPAPRSNTLLIHVLTLGNMEMILMSATRQESDRRGGEVVGGEVVGGSGR